MQKMQSVFGEEVARDNDTSGQGRSGEDGEIPMGHKYDGRAFIGAAAFSFFDIVRFWKS